MRAVIVFLIMPLVFLALLALGMASVVAAAVCIGLARGCGWEWHHGHWVWHG